MSLCFGIGDYANSIFFKSSTVSRCLIGRDAHGVYEYADSGNRLTDWAFTLNELPDLEAGLNLTEDDYYKELYSVGKQEYTLEELVDKFNMKRDYT